MKKIPLRCKVETLTQAFKKMQLRIFSPLFLFNIMNKIHLLSLFLILTLFGCATSNIDTLIAKKGGKKLSPDQVLSLTENNTLRLQNHDSDAYLFMDKSGRVYGVDVVNNKDLGQWDVSEQGEFCVRMNNWWDADMHCYFIYETGGVYKLTSDKGLIKFTSHNFSGDYKNSYYAVHKGKKSYRKSIRSGTASRVSTSEEHKTESSEESSVDNTQNDKTITEVNTYNVTHEDRELRSTVKWMARDCPGCNLSETNLAKADLVGAQLAGANLSGSNLKMAKMRRADLEGANLEEANLSYCSLPGANLKNANLKDADLQGANLIRADLTGADLTGANLDQAHLEGVKGLTR